MRGKYLLPYAPWLCWISPIIGALLILLFSQIKQVRKFRSYAAVASIAFSILFSFSMLTEATNGEIVDIRFPISPPLEFGVLVDPLSVLMAITVSIISLFVAVFSAGYMKDDASLTRYWVLIQLFTSGYLLVVLADNFLFMFVGWEIVGLCVTFLATFNYAEREKARFGLRVNTILRVGDVALLFFIMVVYVYSGTFNFIELSQDIGWLIQLSTSGLLLFSSLMFLGGIVGKAAQFPLHEWLPEMLMGTPSSSNALTECLAGPYLLARVLPLFQNAYSAGLGELLYFFLITAWIGAVTGLLTALAASTQRHPQHVMAYSISSIIGLMLVAFGLSGLAVNWSSGYMAGVTILTVDAFVSALLILTTVFISYSLSSEDLFNMAGLRSRLAHQGMEVAVFAVSNVPIFSGFWLCNWVQALALELPINALHNNPLIIHSSLGIFILLILTGGASAFYAIRLMGRIFGKRSYGRKVRELPRSMMYSLGGLVALTFVLDLSVPLLVPLLNNFFLPIVSGLVFQNAINFVAYIIPSISTVLTITALLVFGSISFMIYYKHKIDADQILEKHVMLAKLHSFVRNRFYISLLYQKIAYYTVGLSIGLYRNVEIEGVKRPRIRGLSQFFDIVTSRMVSFSEKSFHKIELEVFEALDSKIAETTTFVAEKLRGLQTGVLSYNMLLVLVGFCIMLIMALALGGSGGI
ncbi:MAG: proton-conducting transporter membrane subunit [Candidatus Bathyarchaeota archaeon]|nr:proton-conducting transporter membrane subunit [Candidatus Bathyarchaeota archaeon]